jgi:ABC-type uncharacterized transport system auxiliary subunit
MSAPRGRGVTGAALLACALAFVPGCVTFSKPAPQPREYLLSYESPPIQHGPIDVVLRVLPLGIGAPYSTSNIVYRENDHTVGSYTYDRWASPPAAMVGDLLARDLATSGVYRAVLRGPTLMRSDYEISGEVEELGERSAAGCTAHLQLRLLLRHSGPRGGHAVLFQRPYSGDEPCKSNDPDDLVGALSRAMQTISAQIQADANAAIAADASASAAP